MQKANFNILVLLFIFIIISGFSYAGLDGDHQLDAKPRNKTLIIFFDGLRPDYITKEQMPNLFEFRQEACFGSRHHSVFPTVTRVNSASYATGSYPESHGLLGNSIFIPEVNASKAMGTGYADLSKIPAATSGPLLTSVSLGEVLRKAGEQMMVFSSGTTGQAYLQNHTVNGAIINPELILPGSLKQKVVSEIGVPPADGGDDDSGKHKWITDALIKYGLPESGPLVSAIWFSDPDGAAHSHGIGSPEALSAMKFVDEQFRRILQAIDSLKASDRVNIVISTDHGFVTHVGKQSLTDFLIKEGYKKSKDSRDVIVAEGAVYVKDHSKKTIQKIVSALHKEEWIGALFTKPLKKDDLNGWVSGTLSFDVIHYNHPRSGDILVAMDWNDNKNEKGFSGTDYSEGVAGHGGSSPYEINIALFAKGPDFRKSYKGELPTSNVDIAPTILGIYNIPVPSQMDGRVANEFFTKESGPNSTDFKKETFETTAKYSWGIYKLSVQRSVLGKYKYVDYTKVTREPTGN